MDPEASVSALVFHHLLDSQARSRAELLRQGRSPASIWSLSLVELSGVAALGTLPLYCKLRGRKKPTRVFAAHMALFVALLVVGWAIVESEGRQNEHTWLALVPRTENGLASRMAHLQGIEGLAPPRHLELLPYASAREERVAPVRAGGRRPTPARASRPDSHSRRCRPRSCRDSRCS